MKIIAFIPSRYDSSRFPGKPLAPIAGRPMIQHVYDCAVACSQISDVYVTTDDERIFNCVEGFGGSAIMTSKEHRSGSDRIAEAAEKLGLEEEDIVVNIQGDQPVFSSSIIWDMVAPMIDGPDVVMSTVRYRIRNESETENSNIVKVVCDDRDFALYFSRSPIPFYRDPDKKKSQVFYKHLGFYAYRKGFLSRFHRLPKGKLENAEKLEQLRAIEFGFSIKVVDVSSDSVEVDTPEDIKKVERIIAS